MGRIQSNVGLITGVPITDTVEQLLKITAAPRDLLTSRNKAISQEQVAVTELTARLVAVQFAAEKLKQASIFKTKTATSSNSAALAATVTGNAVAGSRQFTPIRSASAHQLLSGGVASPTDPLGEGELTFRFGGFVDRGVELSLLNGGAGVSRGKIRIEDRSGNDALIDLRYAQTIDDVLAAINAADEVEVSAVVEGDRLKLIDTSGGGGSLKVQEVAGGSTAADLGLSGIEVAADEALGSDVLTLSRDSQLAQLNDGLGVRLREAVPELKVTLSDGSELEIDFYKPASVDAPAVAERTLGDLLDTINAVDPAKLKAEISGDGDRIVLTDLTGGAGSFSVANLSGGQLAEELGLTGAAVSGVITGERVLGGLKSSLLSRFDGGSGLSDLGEITLTDRSGDSATVDLSSARTLDDVAKAINDASVDIEAKINAARNGLVLRDASGGTGSLIVASAADSKQTAEKLQIAVNAAVQQKDSGSLRLKVVGENTRLDDLHGGHGISRGQFLIASTNGLAKTFDLRKTDDYQTIGDLIEAINDANLGVKAQINDQGDGIALIDTAHGSQALLVRDTGSGKSAQNLGLLAEVKEVEIDGQLTKTISGSTTYRIGIDADDSLKDLVDKINSLGVLVSASTFQDGSGSKPHRMLLSSQIQGRAGELLIDGSQSGLNFSEAAQAQDALLLVGAANSNGVLAASPNNDFSDLLAGVKLTVGAANSETVSINVATTDSAAATAVKTFVDAYNALRKSLATHTAFNETNQSVGVLFGSNEALRIDTELSDLLSGRFLGAGDLQSLGEVGVTINQDGTLAFDSLSFSRKFTADAEAVEQFFTTENSGVAARLNKLVESLAGRGSSLLVNRAEALNRKIEINTARIEFQTRRIDKERERLLKYFYNLELSIGKLQNNLNAINSLQPLAPLSYAQR